MKERGFFSSAEVSAKKCSSKKIEKPISNNDSNNSNFSNLVTFSESLVLTLIFGSFFMLGTFANIIVILVYIINKDFKNHTNYFFISLSISDLLVLLICIPVTVNDLWSPNVWYFGMIYCKFI